MANRRMFSRRIAESARFLKMGAGAQLLYFHLCLRADDDGVVEAYSVRRGIGANEDDMQNLIGRGFLSVLDPENEVVLITDWNEHNNIRSDRVQPSVYRDVIREKFPEFALKEPTRRSDLAKRERRTDSGPSVDSPLDNQRTTDGRLSIGKVRLGKVSSGEDSGEGPDTLSLSAHEVLEHLNERCGRSFRKTPTSLKEIRARLKDGYSAETLCAIVDFKAAQWEGDAKMRAYLRPSTLFSATNCMNYEQEMREAPPGRVGQKRDFEEYGDVASWRDVFERMGR